MWFSLDRIETCEEPGTAVVVLIDENEKVFSLARALYESMTNTEPREGDMLDGSLAADGSIGSLRFDEAETTRRREAARARMSRLLARRRGRR